LMLPNTSQPISSGTPIFSATAGESVARCTAN
jgi:hypothetical protein